MSIISPHCVKVLTPEEMIQTDLLEKEIQDINKLVCFDWSPTEEKRKHQWCYSSNYYTRIEILEILKKIGWEYEGETDWSHIFIWNPKIKKPIEKTEDKKVKKSWWKKLLGA